MIFICSANGRDLMRAYSLVRYPDNVQMTCDPDLSSDGHYVASMNQSEYAKCHYAHNGIGYGLSQFPSLPESFPPGWIERRCAECKQVFDDDDADVTTCYECQTDCRPGCLTCGVRMDDGNGFYCTECDPPSPEPRYGNCSDRTARV